MKVIFYVSLNTVTKEIDIYMHMNESLDRNYDLKDETFIPANVTFIERQTFICCCDQNTRLRGRCIVFVFQYTTPFLADFLNGNLSIA